MMIYEHDPDVVRWGLHHLDVCSVSNSGTPGVTTHYDNDRSKTEYVNEGFCEPVQSNVENDEMIAHALQEELKRVSDAEVSGFSQVEGQQQQASVLAQDWQGSASSLCRSEGRKGGDNQSHQEELDNNSDVYTEEAFLPEMVDEYILDGEVGKRLIQINALPHVPRVNGQIPSVDEVASDHQRLLDRLDVYDLVELKISGDGNCQFRSLSDQIYRSAEHHQFVREQVVMQLKSHPDLYMNYVPMGYEDYLKKMSKNGEWGDHVTLQAAADSYGVKIFVITSFRDTCYIEILPQSQKSKRSES
ncbi:cysteine protease [Lithospermum erythrorhizon]|uniref:ubiquitinyl hydrolase 1 n=1 Tax=Lithospermum erythrorhizon TaxID=34254 RepID=A0AAV3QI15_LITER